MLIKRLSRLLLIAGAVVVLTVGFLWGEAHSAEAQDDAVEVVVLEANGVISPPFANYVARGLAFADDLNAEAIVLILDTPGGDASVTLDIVQDIRNSDVPVVVFVGPRGAKAGSAGLFVTLAGHVAAMAPETAIGASSPIMSTGEDLPSTAERKAVEFFRAEVRSLSERRGAEAQAVAEAAVSEALAVSSSEALAVGLIDFITEDVDTLLRDIDGFEVDVSGRTRRMNTGNVRITIIPMTLIDRILMLLTDPNIVFLLLSIAPIAIIVEIRTPGGWVSGVVGVISLGLALYGLGVMPVNWLGIVFVLLAFVMFLLEIKAPVHGIPTAGGVISLAVGGVILFNEPGVAPFGTLSIPLVIGQSVFLGAIFVFFATLAVRAQSRRPTTGYEGLTGQIGRVTKDIDPVGMVYVWGERWKAVSDDGSPIAEGEAIVVVSAERMRLRVRAVSEADFDRLQSM